MEKGGELCNSCCMSLWPFAVPPNTSTGANFHTYNVPLIVKGLELIQQLLYGTIGSRTLALSFHCIPLLIGSGPTNPHLYIFNNIMSNLPSNLALN